MYDYYYPSTDYRAEHEANSQSVKDFCRKHLYQMVQVETNEGGMHTGLLHSYDNNNMYLLMPSGHQGQQGQQAEGMNEEESRLFFPFFGPFGLFGFPFFGIRRFGPFYPYWW
ncbi:hypothetical protein [Halobacillus massiliensis]|uniref:hypothetical protein n=1 Tax=Halobacillus massiliensis TaxID=1926286 RepID=UPI0009E4A801|nr:hypothetical protein [Halobacillus massiliensis]